MKPLEKELQNLKTWDEVQQTTFPEYYQGYPKIITAGHGYLAVRKGDMNYATATHYATFMGEKACYLEEDCEAPAFIEDISKI